MSRSKLDCLNSLKKCNIPISAIVDVGVNTMTKELIQCFPDKKHFLFEINPIYNSQIETNYKGINYSLFNIGLSDSPQKLYRVGTSLLRNNVVTHTRLSESPVDLDMFTLECEPVEIRRADSLGLSIPGNSLIKIDIDGHDIQAAVGFGNILAAASVVIIESTANKISETLLALSKKGFNIVDIVDMIYYGESLYQCDLVFTRADLINDKLRPSISNFQEDAWNKY